MKYLGLDSSSKAIHGVILDEKENLISIHKFTCNVKNPFKERFSELIDNFVGDLGKINVVKNIDHVFIEEPIFAQNRSVVRTLSEVVGAVWAIMVICDLPTQLVDNGTWKKNVIGNGKAKKDDIMNYAIEKWGDKFPEQDYADAACIALYAVKEKNGST